MHLSKRIVFLFAVCLCSLPLSSATAQIAQQGPATEVSGGETKLKRTITAILERQARAWNQGDLEEFMQAYWKSDQLTFSSGGKTTRGWQATLDRYKTSYPTRAEMGNLTFDQFELTPIGTSAALMLGQWNLAMADGTTVRGNFSIVLKKIDDGWKIIHDHSSTLEPEPPESGDANGNPKVET